MNLQYRVEKIEQGKVNLVFEGSITVESSGILGEVLQKVKEPKCVINLMQVKKVDSLGIRSWIRFMESFSTNREIEFEECSPIVVMQINMIPEFSMGAKIISVYGEFTCPSCEKEQWKRIQPLENHDQAVKLLWEQKCTACSEQLELDVDEESYLNFLRDDR